MTSLTNTPSLPRLTMRMCRAKYRLRSSPALCFGLTLTSHTIHSLLKRNFGNDIFNQNFSIHTGLPSVPQQLNTLSKTTQSSISIWKGRMMVSFFCSGVAGPADIIFPLELEPRKPRDDEVDMFIDLEATREDHEEVRNLNFHDPFHTCVNFTTIL